ncbi:MAG: exodeoxyribonuclease III [Ignavibacteria bacterium GWF2_33_9]|nr:MAG: exodeoxyribonuclease III [Ignavibacteria bacterium GWF2_33_9]
MNIITWNINGYRSVVGQNPRKVGDKKFTDNLLFEYIYSSKPDIICLQETKSEPEQIKPHLQAPEGYTANYNWSKARKGYSGVVTFSKIPVENAVSEIGVEIFDIEGRIMQTDYEGFSLLNIYFPNGGRGIERVDYKLKFYDAIAVYTNKLREKGRKLIMCGDYNTAHNEIDLARPKENEKTSGFLPEERVKLDELVENGWVDAFRQFNKEPENYTWWDQKTRARDRNIGWRIDYHFFTQDLTDKVKGCKIYPEVMGSDHCPVEIILDI